MERKRKERNFLNVGFIAADRLGDGAEGVKRKIKNKFRKERKGRIHWGKRVKNF